MKRLTPFLAALAAAAWCSTAHSFCGFYVASGEAKVFNKASQVVLARDGDRTVMTMANDFKGEPKQFAVVVPVPTVLEKGQIHVGDPGLISRIDAYSAPRLVEYFDEDPCQMAAYKRMAASAPTSSVREQAADAMLQRGLGVTIEARYTVGEYDILILSARQSTGLATWLSENGYRVPAGAARVIDVYLKQGMKFFVAKVNLSEQRKLGFSYLRPIQIAYESPKFMLPIRLGMANADGPQELYVYALTRKGRVETVNYRTVKLPSDAEIPAFVKDEFPRFYRDLFGRQVAREKMSVVFTEYAWDMGWCDPCAAAPLTAEEQKGLGVFWLDDPGAANAGTFITRLHVRYDRASFPEDLVFQETADRTNFQGRYVLRHEWTGAADCPGARAYRASLPERRRTQARTLAELTGWDLADIRGRMEVAADWSRPGELTLKWWERLWGAK
jgi:hypothetical protein